MSTTHTEAFGLRRHERFRQGRAPRVLIGRGKLALVPAGAVDHVEEGLAV
jgi:hypothetical protein